MACDAVRGSEFLDVFWHDGMLKHDPGNGVFDTMEDPGFLDVLDKHPENSERVRNMLSILRRGPISPYIRWHTGRPAKLSELHTFHDPEYIRSLVEGDACGGVTLCSGTRLNAGSWDSALLAAGTTLEAMQYILDGHGKKSYALVRPPGHHAQRTQADGYCFLNNAALAVQLALESGCKRVAVVDIDVHYGNGTADGFYERDDVLTISLHMNHGSWGPSHPQTGLHDEVGKDKGRGFNMNVPLPNGTGDKGYVHTFNALVVPALSKFEPEMLVFVIGQDSSAFDPNGRQCLTMDGYRMIGKIMHQEADRLTNGQILVVQEGGYHITYSAYCLHATLEGVLNITNPLLLDPIAYYPDLDESMEIIEYLQQYWQKNCSTGNLE
eukprot:TRINITY_DN6378_c0_g1_i1.p1 TRINITY_DN6378_c0_g1~~TRINITY_DN6378_c0_g1_i1.p1  ORF type:complete len:423 (+),score=64.06 TRINITY_DN6378_c0_g1_i1:128-1270(+)